MAIGANSINLLFVIIVEIAGAFATAMQTDITWIKRVIKKHGEDITKFQDKL